MSAAGDGSPRVGQVDNNRLFLLMGLVGFAFARFALRASQMRSANQELKEQVQTWEGEGGNVADVPTVNLPGR